MSCGYNLFGWVCSSSIIQPLNARRLHYLLSKESIDLFRHIVVYVQGKYLAKPNFRLQID